MPKEDFQDATVLQDPTKVIRAKVTYRLREDGVKLFSYTLLRKMESDSDQERVSPWFHLRHIDAIRQVLDSLEDYLWKEIGKTRAEAKGRRTPVEGTP